MKARHVRKLRAQIERNRCPAAVNRVTHVWSMFGVPDPFSMGFLVGWECGNCGEVEWE